MPKRTNQYQRIISYISQRLAPTGATVRESVELPEDGTGTLREVDTLIEFSAGLTVVRVAVETRFRQRPADVRWIDELIGKYARLPVDRVIALSARGFSRAARRKAEHHNIEALTPRLLAKQDWPAMFQKRKFMMMTPRVRVEAFTICLPDDFPDDSIGESSIGTIVLPGGSTLALSFDQFHAAVHELGERLIHDKIDAGENTILKAMNLAGANDVAVDVPSVGWTLSHGDRVFPIERITVHASVTAEDRREMVFAAIGDGAIVGRVSSQDRELSVVLTERRDDFALFFDRPKKSTDDVDASITILPKR